MTRSPMEFASLEPTKLVTVELFTLPSQSLTHSVTLPSRSQMPSAFLPLLHTGWTSISEFSDVQLLLVLKQCCAERIHYATVERRNAIERGSKASLEMREKLM